MLVIRNRSRVVAGPKPLLAAQKVSRKYRQACIRRTEYRKLKAIVPSIARKKRVSKVRVVEEAIRYIDELHRALFRRAPILADRYGTDLPSSPVEPQEFVSRLLAATNFPSSSAQPVTSPTVVPAVTSLPQRKLAQPMPTLPPRPLQSSNCVNRRKL